MLTLTWFKLNPDARVILYLLDHLSVSANDDTHSKPGDGDLKDDETQKQT